MRRDELKELHYITPIANVASIRSRGLLCYRIASKLPHASVASAVIQERRAPKGIPGGKDLHAYVNLYINGRNPMLYAVLCRYDSSDLCVLRVSTKVMDIPGCLVSDQNAASAYARFRPAPEGLQAIEKTVVFAERWTHPEDPIHEWRHKAAMCAEVLVPSRVAPEYVIGAYVAQEDTVARVQSAWPGLPVVVNSYIFFR